MGTLTRAVSGKYIWDYCYGAYGETLQGTLFGDSYWDTANHWLRLTRAVGSINGVIEYHTLNPGDPFICEFDFIMVNAGGADALWFHFFKKAMPTNEDDAGDGYIVAYDEYSGQIQLKWAGTALANPSQSGMQTAWRKAKIYHSGVNIKVYYEGSKVIDFDDSARDETGTYIGFGARTGGSNNEHRVRNLRCYKNELIKVHGLTENNFVELIGSGGTILASATADVSGDASIDISGLSTRPPYSRLYIWADSTKASLIYMTTFTWAYRDIIWGGDEFTYGAGSDPDGHTSIAEDSVNWTEVLAAQTHVKVDEDSASYVEVLVSSWTVERILERDVIDNERIVPVYDNPFGRLDNCLYKIEGVTKDSAGAPLGSCTVILMKTNRMGVNGYSIMQSTTSHASTGAYKFYVRDPDTEYFVIAFKAGPPNMFGRTDRDVKAVAI